MKINDIFNKDEIELISKATKLEDKIYTKDDFRVIKNNIIDDIFSRSSKNGDIQKARLEYSNILDKLNYINNK